MKHRRLATPRRQRGCRSVWWSLVACACFSAAPPAPPVRYFDPLPPASPAAGQLPAAIELRVTAAPHLGREFVVRTAAREIQIDDAHSWFVEPRLLVATALERRLRSRERSDGATVVGIDVEAFELDVTETPRAHVRLRLDGVGASQPVEAWAPASDRSPAAFAAAMAEALDRAGSQVQAVLSASLPAQRRP
ncbi:MAG TPA: hypothetical protein VFZ65_23265 [Planctomycetota bacterium]|nr:hypothetical protein [Planctomycetota bacterium]